MPQKKVETERVSVSSKTSPKSSVSWSRQGVYFGSGVSVMGVPISPTTQLPIPNDELETQIVTWVDFQFENGISVLPFLKTSFKNTNEIIDLLKKEIL
ncbi:hypothetical protein HOH45_01640 [bacterium]|nr:hypothetical protein [bacterium]